jgi:hypothetical protein
VFVWVFACRQAGCASPAGWPLRSCRMGRKSCWCECVCCCACSSLQSSSRLLLLYHGTHLDLVAATWDAGSAPTDIQTARHWQLFACAAMNTTMRVRILWGDFAGVVAAGGSFLDLGWGPSGAHAVGCRLLGSAWVRMQVCFMLACSQHLFCMLVG